MTVDPRENRLPKWAQLALISARRDVSEANKRAEECRLATNPERTDTVVRRYRGEAIGLPKGEPVRFRLGDLDDAWDWVDVRVVEDGEIELSGCMGLTFRPQASNVLRVGLDR